MEHIPYFKLNHGAQEDKIMATPIKAVSFDLWDTVFIDDSDEPKRAAQGLVTKVEARQFLLLDALSQHHNVDADQVRTAYKSNEEVFRRVWHDEFKTMTVSHRIGLLLEEMGLSLPDEALDRVVRGWEEMEHDIAPDLAPGVADVLERLAGQYSLAVISDAIVSPGRVLRLILQKYGLLDYFKVFTFSDEIGASKPAPIVFEDTVRQLLCQPGEVVHIGDRGHNDIQGPHMIGMKAILYTGVKPRPMEEHKPDAVCGDYTQLPDIIASL